MKHKIFVLLFLLFTSVVNAQIINTIAGDSTGGYNTDGVAATKAELFSPTGVAVDDSGNVYIADFGNNRVRKVNALTGIITTVAGNGGQGYTGDDVQATATELYWPAGVALDDSGNIYIADELNNRIRKVTKATGIITTIAGNGTGGYNGDGREADTTEIYSPNGVAVDATHNVYIVDQQNNCIRKVTAATGIINIIAGDLTQGYNTDNIQATAAELNDPCGVALDDSGNVYIADQANSRIRKVTTSTGVITTVAGNGLPSYSGDGIQATAAELWSPSGVSVDDSGNIYIADYNNFRVRKVIRATGIITTIAGKGVQGFTGDGELADSAKLNGPQGVAVDASGNIYIADANNNRIREVGKSNDSTAVTINGTSFCPCTTLNISFTSTGVFNTGNIYTVQLSDANGNFSAPDTIGTLQSTADSGTINVTIPCNAGAGTTYKIRVVSSNPIATGSDNGTDLTISKPVLAGTITSAKDTICQFTRIVLSLTGNTGNTIQWQSSDSTKNFTNITGATNNDYTSQALSQTTYFRVYVTRGACSDTSAIFKVETLPSPVAYFTFFSASPNCNRFSFNSGGSTGAISYHWDFGDGTDTTAENPIHTYDSIGTYHVCLTVTNGSNCSYTLCQIVSCMGGINQVASAKDVNIFPNPNEGAMNIVLNGSGYNSIKIFDVTGREVYAQLLDEGKQDLSLPVNISNSSNGIYILQVITKDGIVSKQVVKGF